MDRTLIEVSANYDDPIIFKACVDSLPPSATQNIQTPITVLLRLHHDIMWKRGFSKSIGKETIDEFLKSYAALAEKVLR